MTAYIVRRLFLIIPTLFGIMVINFAVIQFVPGGPVDQMIAEMTGTAVESTARFSGSDAGENIANYDMGNVNDSKYRGAQGLDPEIIKEIEIIMKKNAKIIAAILSKLEIFDELIGIKKSKKAFICIPRLQALSQKIEQVENFSATDVNNF